MPKFFLHPSSVIKWQECFLTSYSTFAWSASMKSSMFLKTTSITHVNSFLRFFTVAISKCFSYPQTPNTLTLKRRLPLYDFFNRSRNHQTEILSYLTSMALEILWSFSLPVMIKTQKSIPLLLPRISLCSGSCFSCLLEVRDPSVVLSPYILNLYSSKTNSPLCISQSLLWKHLKLHKTVAYVSYSALA